MRAIAAMMVSAAVGLGAMATVAVAQPRLDSTEIVFDASVPAMLEVKRAPTGHLLVRPVVNGEEAGWFIFDTGAGICCVSTPHVDRLGLKDSGSVQAMGVGGSEQSRLVTAETVTLGPATVRDHVLMVTDLSFLEEHLGDEIVGVIGYGVLNKCVVEMDLVEGRIGLHEPGARDAGEMVWEELNVRDRVPVVRARFEGREGEFRLDTGAKGHVTFHAPAVREWDLLKDRETTASKMGGVGGFVEARSGEVAWFEIGGVRTEHVPATFAVEGKGTFGADSKAGNVGVELLTPFVLWFDYANSRIAFVQRGE